MGTEEVSEERLAEVEASDGMELRLIPIAAIRREHNPRSAADMAGIRQLAQSIAMVGLIHPVAVSALEDGEYALVAGGRRLEACVELRRKEVPGVVLEEDGAYLRRARSLAENMGRKAMSPTDEAEAIAQMMRELGLAVEDVAEALGISAATARSRLDLLDLPRPLREHLRAGRLTLQSGTVLAELARGSSELASEVGERVASGALERKALDEDAGAVVAEIATEEDPSGPFCVPFSEGTRLQIGEVASRIRCHAAYAEMEEKGQEEIKRLAEAPPSELVEVRPEDVLRARAWGGLIEYRRDRFSTSAFLVDDAFAADWLAEAATRRLSVDGPAEAEAKESPDEESLEAERLRRERERNEARAANEIVGRRSQVNLDYQSEVSLEQATVLASLVVDRYGRELVQGLRLTRVDWNQHEAKEMRSGAVRTVERPAEPDEARAKFEELLAKAESGPQLIGRLYAAIVAAVGADQRAVASSQQRALSLPFAPGRSETVIGRAPEALLASCEDLLTETRLGAVREELGVGLAGELPDRRSKRQREREEAERAAREEEAREVPELSGTLLDELEEARAAAPSGSADSEEEEGS